MFGILPSEFRKRYDAADDLQVFRKADIMNTEFDRQDKASEERYPDVKVIKEMPQMHVACFTYFGEPLFRHSTLRYIRKNSPRYQSQNADTL